MLKAILCAGVVAFALPGAVPGVAADTSPAPALLGAWQDGTGDLLPPGVAHFEAIQSRLLLAPDGAFTLTVDKAAGTLRQTGTYTVRGQVLTLCFPTGTVSYGFCCRGDTLTLQAQRTPSAKPIMLGQMPGR